jgi:hypothetical protein
MMRLVKVWFCWVMRFLKSPEGGVHCLWFRTAGFNGSGGVNCGKGFLRFFHTFSPWNTHVQMKARAPSLMKPSDNREEVLFREARPFLASAVERRALGPRLFRSQSRQGVSTISKERPYWVTQQLQHQMRERNVP